MLGAELAWRLVATRNRRLSEYATASLLPSRMTYSKGDECSSSCSSKAGPGELSDGMVCTKVVLASRTTRQDLRAAGGRLQVRPKAFLGIWVACRLGLLQKLKE